jgi:hypothetical protein
MIADQPYWVDNGVYYQQCYQGAAMNYCVVADPN